MKVVDWLTVPKRRPLLYWAMGVILLVVAVSAVVVHERQVEHRAIRAAAKITYQNQLASCRRGLGLRLQVRANAQAEAKAYRVLGGFLKGARPRALAQSQDMNISTKSRVAAKGSLTSIDDGIAALSARIAIPPAPTPCDEVVTDPNAPVRPPHHS